MRRTRRPLLVALVLIAATGLVARWVPGAAEARFNRVTGECDPAGERALRLHASLTIADLHADTLLWHRDPTRRGDRGHVDLPRLLEGNVALQVFSTVSRAPAGPDYQHGRDRVGPLVVAQRWPPRTWRSPRERTLYQASRLERAAAASGGRLAIVRTADELRRALTAPGSVAGLLAIEGLHALEGDPDTLERFHDAGFRMMGLAHFFDNELAGSSWGGAKHGLTPLGREVVARMEALGIVVDLAHASPAAIDDVLAIATRPVVVSHTGVQATCPGPRNLADRHVDAIAAAGGLIGIGFFEAAVCGTDPARIAVAIRHVADRVGVERVAIGSDFDGAVATAFDAADLATLTQALIDEGFTDDEIARIMGGNAIELLGELLPGGSGSATAAPETEGRAGAGAAYDALVDSPPKT